MRIGVVTQYFPCKEQPYRGHSAFQTVKRLTRHADVEVFCPQLRYPSFLTPRHRPWSKTDTTFSVPDVPTTLFDYPALPVLSRVFNGSVCAHYLAPLLRERNLDVLLNYWIYPDGYAAARCAQQLGIPVILKAIGSDINEARGATGLLTRATLRQADCVLTVSHALRERVVSMGVAPGNARAVLNGCDDAIFHLADQQQARAELNLDLDKRYLLYVGRLDAAKGLRELIRATALLSRSTPDVHLILIGEGPLRPELETLVAEHHLQGRVTFAGTFPTEQLGRWFAAADLFTLPSYNEGCPNVVVEALNSGRPVVASRVGGIPEILTTSSGILVPPRDVPALAAALQQALYRPWNHAAIARSAHRSWNDVADEVFAVCNEVVARRRASRPSSAPRRRPVPAIT